MEDKKIDYRSVIVVTDIVILSSIVLGVLGVLYVFDTAPIKFIGIGVGVIGIVAQLLSIAKRAVSNPPISKTTPGIDSSLYYANLPKYTKDPATNKMTFDDLPSVKEQRSLMEDPPTTKYVAPSSANKVNIFDDKTVMPTTNTPQEQPQQLKKSTLVFDSFDEDIPATDTTPLPVVQRPIPNQVAPQPQQMHRPEVPFSKPTVERTEQPLYQAPIVAQQQPLNTSNSNPDAQHVQRTNDITKEVTSEYSKEEVSVKLAQLFEETPNIFSREPRKEFNYLVSKVLTIIASVFDTRTVVFFWVNKDKETFTLETYLTDARFFSEQKKYSFGFDGISDVASKGKPIVITDIKTTVELKIIPYYTSESSTGSFIAVPIFFNNIVVGVVAIDSTEEKKYTAKTIDALGNYTKLISGLIQSYTSKYDLIQETKILESVQLFKSMFANSSSTKDEVIDVLLASIEQLAVGNPLIGICMFDESMNEWGIVRTSNAINHPELRSAVVELNNSLVGHTILSGATVIAHPLHQEKIRFYSGEPSTYNTYFFSVPIKSIANCFGALFLEGNNFERILPEQRSFEFLAEQVGIILEQIAVNEAIQSNSMVNDLTGIMNYSQFTKRLQDEILRATDFRQDISICLIRIDSMQQRLESKPLMTHLSSLVTKFVRPYDVVSQIDDQTIVVCLISMKAENARIWSEKFKKSVSMSTLTLIERTVSLTVSIGICEFHPSYTVERFLSNADEALKNSQKRGNSINIY